MNIFKKRFLESVQTDADAGGGGEQEGGPPPEAPPPEVVEAQKEAKKMGWRPREQWRGNPDDWVDAQEFLDRGKTFIPFLNNERHRLQGELGQRDKKIQELEGALQATRESVAELKELHAQIAEDRREDRKAEVATELRAAREAGDDVKVAELQNELQQLIKPVEQKPPAKPPAATPPANNPDLPQWSKDWISENQEFLKNPRNTALFNAVLLERRQKGDVRGFKQADGSVVAGGPDLMEEVRAEVNAVLHPNTRRAAPPRSEGSSPSNGSGGSGGGKTYASLPAEARAKCDQQEAKFVGPKGSGKLFENQAAWRKHYAAEYFRAERVMLNRD